MCMDPVSIATTAASGLGSLLNARETHDNNVRAIEARNAATEAELERQKGYQQQAGGIFDNVLSRFAPPAQVDSLVDNQTKAANFIRGNQPTDFGSIRLAGASQRSQDAEQGALADVFSRGAERADALGALEGYGQQGFSDDLAMSDASRRLGVVNDASRGSASLVDLERGVNAANSQKTPSGFGDLLSFVGNVGGFKAGEGTLPNLFGGGTAKLPKINPLTASQGVIY